MKNSWVLTGLLQSRHHAKHSAGMAHSPSPLEWSISDKQLEMGQNIDISGLVCWHVTPKYTILLLETIMSGSFLTLTMAKAENGSENPEISSKLIHPGKYSFPWERGVWANNPGFVVAQLLACKACGVCLTSCETNPGMSVKSLPRQRSHWHQCPLSQRWCFTGIWEM